MTDADTPGVFRHCFSVPAEAVDGNGHVNNVVYVQWMQDVAILHSGFTGGREATHAAGATWVARSHHIEYLSPAFEGEEVCALTWVADMRRVRSTRRYHFLRKKDDTLLARGQTDWVFVDATSGRPRMIPAEVIGLFTLVPDS